MEPALFLLSMPLTGPTLPDRLADRPSGRGHQVPSCSPTYTDMLIKGIHTDRQAGRHCFMLCCLRLTSQVVCLYVTAQLEVVDQHGGKAGGGAEDAAVGHEDVYLGGVNTCRRGRKKGTWQAAAAQA
jgi:hypothetical protein